MRLEYSNLLLKEVIEKLEAGRTLLKNKNLGREAEERHPCVQFITIPRMEKSKLRWLE